MDERFSADLKVGFEGPFDAEIGDCFCAEDGEEGGMCSFEGGVDAYDLMLDVAANGGVLGHDGGDVEVFLCGLLGGSLGYGRGTFGEGGHDGVEVMVCGWTRG